MAASTTARLQALYSQTLTKLEEAMATVGPSYTLPGGITVDRVVYIRELQAQLKAYAEMPGVVPDVKPVFTHISVAR